MTEEEAKTKWCPHSRFKFASTGDSASCNREGGPGVGPNLGGTNPWLLSGTRCLGSACMSWRWVETPSKRDPAQSYRDGFCGLAGKP